MKKVEYVVVKQTEKDGIIDLAIYTHDRVEEAQTLREELKTNPACASSKYYLMERTTTITDVPTTF